MKKNINQIIYILLLVVATIRCNEPGGNLPAIQTGGNARVVFAYPDNAYLKVTDLSSAALIFDVYSDNSDLDHIDYSVTYKNYTGYVAPAKLAKTLINADFVNGKASKITLTADQLAKLFGVAGGATGLAAGESFVFTQKLYLKDGRTFDGTNSAPSITTGANSSFTPPFPIFVACPFVLADALGTYTITRDDIGVTIDDQVEIVAGPGANQVTMKDLFGHPEKYDIIMDVNPIKGDITIAKQNAWNCANVGCTFGVATMEATTGTFFSCTGFIFIDATHRVAAGSFGINRLELQKN